MIQHVLCKIWRFESKECLVKVSVLCLGVHNLQYRVNVTCGKKAVLTAWRHWKCLDSKRQDADKLQWCAAKCSHCVLMNCANWALTGISFLIAAATALRLAVHQNALLLLHFRRHADNICCHLCLAPSTHDLTVRSRTVWRENHFLSTTVRVVLMPRTGRPGCDSRQRHLLFSPWTLPDLLRRRTVSYYRTRE